MFNSCHGHIAASFSPQLFNCIRVLQHNIYLCFLFCLSLSLFCHCSSLCLPLLSLNNLSFYLSFLFIWITPPFIYYIFFIHHRCKPLHSSSFALSHALLLFLFPSEPTLIAPLLPIFPLQPLSPSLTSDRPLFFYLSVYPSACLTFPVSLKGADNT